MRAKQLDIPSDWLSVMQLSELSGLSHARLGNAASKTGMRWQPGMSAYDSSGRMRYSPEAAKTIVDMALTDSLANRCGTA